MVSNTIETPPPASDSHRAGARQVRIDALNRRGEGVATDGTAVPYTVPGDIVIVPPGDGRTEMLGLIASGPDRVPAFCPHFTVCGGCAVQTLAPAPYARWKRDLLTTALRRAGLQTPVDALRDGHGAGRRRVTFHARIERDGRTVVGFMRARAHEIVAIDTCPVLDPGLDGALAAARAIATTLATSGKPLDIVVLATQNGMDIDLRGHGPLDDAARARLVALAEAHDLARLANHGIPVITRRPPHLRIGRADVEPPPGVFQQATARGEEILADLVGAGRGEARRIADLFAGIGTFALRLAAAADVAAYDNDAPALAALDHAARHTDGLRPVRVEPRDLFSRPLTVPELAPFDLVVVDPPRAGAEAQMQAIAQSAVSRVISVACDAHSFARDASILVAAGFDLTRVVPVDQFRHTAHLEIVATLHRPPKKPKRRLLG